jgi:hypothetical protein
VQAPTRGKRRGEGIGQSKPKATKQDCDDDGGQGAHDESGCKPNWQGETTSGGVSELRLALVGNIFPSCSHQFLGALVVGSSKLCREFPTVLGKLSILGNCFHRVTSRDNVRRAALHRLDGLAETLPRAQKHGQPASSRQFVEAYVDEDELLRAESGVA